MPRPKRRISPSTSFRFCASRTILPLFSAFSELSPSTTKLWNQSSQLCAELSASVMRRSGKSTGGAHLTVNASILLTFLQSRPSISSRKFEGNQVFDFARGAP